MHWLIIINQIKYQSFNITILDDFTFRLCDDTDVEIFQFKEFGKNLMKTSKCSPDAFVQMTLQLAYYR